MARLVLTRKKDQGVALDGPGEVYVQEVRGEQVKLAFVAPEATRVMRTELLDRPPKGSHHPVFNQTPSVGTEVVE